MNNPFISDAKTRLNNWKLVRQDISQIQDPEEKINKCLTFWKQAGFENYYLDWDKCENWPGPWDLLWDNHFCPSALSLGIAYTLIMSSADTFDGLCLKLIMDRTHSIQKIVVDWDKWWINVNYLDIIDKNKLKTSLTLNKWVYIDKAWHTE